MKIYITFPKSAANTAYPWKKFVYEQVEETVDLIRDYLYNIKTAPFPSFYQEDTHSHFVVRNGEHYYFNQLMYKLFFVWEPADFQDDDLSYEEVLRLFGLEPDYQEPIPDGYVYLGTHCMGQNINLPGLVLDAELLESGDEVLDGCMFNDIYYIKEPWS